MEGSTVRKPSVGLAFVTFVGIAGIISYGLLGLGLDAHVPIALAAIFAGLTGRRCSSNEEHVKFTLAPELFRMRFEIWNPATLIFRATRGLR